METDFSKTKKVILIFLLFTFAITYLMGLVMFFIAKHVDANSPSSFAIAQMLYPALVVIILKIYCEKNNIHKNLMTFFKLYIAYFSLSMVTLIVGVFTFPKYLSIVLNILIVIFSVIAFVLIIKNKDNCYDSINMNFRKSLKTVVLLGLIFLGLKLVIFFISTLICSGPAGIISNMQGLFIGVVSFIVTMLIGIPLSFIPFFGEELGWRGFLQPKLQSLFGKKLGVIILGVIWGVWHLPLCIMLYSPKTPVYCIILYIFYCTLLGIFISFVYMKTQNLWSAILIHLINNSMVFGTKNLYNFILTPETLLVSIISYAIVFLPFLFTKEYKKDALVNDSNDSLDIK